MLTFDYNTSNRKLLVKTEDSSLFDKIREHFSVENEGARFARYRGCFAARRKYAITGTGNCEPGLYWDIRQYLIQEQIKVDIEITDKLKKVKKRNPYAQDLNLPKYKQRIVRSKKAYTRKGKKKVI